MFSIISKHFVGASSSFIQRSRSGLIFDEKWAGRLFFEPAGANDANKIPKYRVSWNRKLGKSPLPPKFKFKSFLRY